MSINALHKTAIGGARADEERLFENLGARFRLFVHQRVWNKEDAEEVVQDALMVIAREYRSIRFQTSFAAWAYKVLDNRILSYIKAKRQHESRTEPMYEEVNAAPECQLDPDLKTRLLHCLKKLCEVNGRYARILNLHYQGYGTDDICTRLALTQNNSYVVLSRARAMLKSCMENGELRHE